MRRSPDPTTTRPPRTISVAPGVEEQPHGSGSWTPPEPSNGRRRSRLGRWFCRFLHQEGEQNWPWHVLFIRWVKHERIAGTKIFTDQSWLPRNIPYFPAERHEYPMQMETCDRPITEVFRDLLCRTPVSSDPTIAYFDFERRIFSSRADLLCYLLESDESFVIRQAVEWVLNEENLARRISLKGADNDPTSTVYEGQLITNGGRLVVNPFTVDFRDWREWALNRLLYDFVRGVEMQLLKRVHRREYLRRWLACTWKPVDLSHAGEEEIREAIDKTMLIGSIRVVKLLKKTEVPGRMPIELPCRFDLLYRLVNRFRLIDLKTPFTRVFYPLIATIFGPSVKLGELNLLDYFGVRWKCPCFWTGTSLFRVDRTIIW